MNEKDSAVTQLQPHFDDIQAHYDISDDFFGLFQDPSRTYSCAYFEPPGLSLEDAQIAKIDLNLDKLDLQPGMTAAAGVRPCAAPSRSTTSTSSA
jgi:cyclopropane-fatty-acyl-phospholipid synthase